MFRPCIDIHNNQVKQIVGASLNNKNRDLKVNFVSHNSADYYARLYKENNLKGGHIIMLDNRSREQAVKALNAYPQGMRIGGGMNKNNCLEYINFGASHIIFNSAIFYHGRLNLEDLKSIKKVLGKSRIVLDLSCKEYDGKFFVMSNKWKEKSNFEINLKNLSSLSQFCDEFLVHSVLKEGTVLGIDWDLVKLLNKVSPIKTVYAGGIKNFEEIKMLDHLTRGKIDFTIGSGLDIFGGSQFSFEDLVAYNCVR